MTMIRTTPSAALSDAPPATWRRWTALGVPGLVALGTALALLQGTAFAHDTFHDCHYFGPSLRMHIAAWAGLACGLAAPMLYVALCRGAARRGWDHTATRASGLALAVLILGVLPLLLEMFGVWVLYAPDPSGGYDCSGLAVLGPAALPAG
ncbi:hypothetical protein [Streptomyces yunnanensis]|uniref:Uncharacterized protein n=2 Tax=Streptomyces TaxID=1883 RepID=A0A2N8PDT6_STRNR|nr:hypothetical protein [Streptomyces yunnanensis]PNE39187.1 hypothetical protein AOB60_35345 [Streptomyces noursei]